MPLASLCRDREVNLKVLLGVAVARGRLARRQRDQLLAADEQAVAGAVLAGVERGLVALDWAAVSSATDLSAYEALLEDLEDAGLVNPEVEALPTKEELSRRREAGAGLSRPELAVLFAYARSELARAIDSSPLTGEEALTECALRYFPPTVRQGFSDLVPEHPLYHQLVACELGNEIVDRMGAIWAHELAAETGREMSEVAASYWAARQVMAVESNFADVDELGWSASAPGEAALRHGAGEALDRLARWYLSQPGPLRPGEVIGRDRPCAVSLEVAGAPPGPAGGELLDLGVPAAAAARARRLDVLASVGELAQAARTAGRPLEDARDASPVIDDGLCLRPLWAAVRGRPAPDRWERAQLHSLADDLVHYRAEAVGEALQRYRSVDGPAAAHEWLGEKAAARRRVSVLARHVDLAAPPSLSLLALAVRATGDALGSR